MKQWTVLTGLVCLGIGASQVAQGAEGLSWDLAGQTVRYRIQTDIVSPQAIPIAAKKNDAFRSNHVQATVDTRCGQAVARGKKAWELTCTLQDVSLRAGFTAGNEEAAETILKEWTADLRGATVQVILGRNGVVRSVDLDKGTAKNRRESEIQNVQEMILARVYTGLDAQLPKDGTEGGTGQWTIKQANTMGTPSADGVMGAIRGRGVPTASSGISTEFRYVQQGIVERLDDQVAVTVGETDVYPSSGWLPFVHPEQVPVLADLE